MLGLTLEEATAPPFDVWESNWESVMCFDALGTQWRVGMAGPTGLDYGAIPSVLRLLHIPAKRRAQLFEDIRVMEEAALQCMARNRK